MAQGHVSEHPKWDHDHFLGFLLLYAARADMDYSESEREYIQSKIDPQAMKEVQSEFDDCKDYECIRIIEKYRDRFFANAEQKSELLVRIEELFESDGHYTITENNLFMMLRKLL